MSNKKKMRDAEALEEVRKTVLEMCSQQPVGSYVSAAQLIPYLKWKDLSAVKRSQLGRQISLLVALGELPLLRAKPVGVTKHYLTI